MPREFRITGAIPWLLGHGECVDAGQHPIQLRLLHIYAYFLPLFKAWLPHEIYRKEAKFISKTTGSFEHFWLLS